MKRKTQCFTEGRATIPRQQTPHGCPDTDVFVHQEIPQSMWPWILMDSGLVCSRSRKRREAMVAIRKQPSVMISGRD